MNITKARELKKFAEKFRDPHTYLVTHMSTCKNADELTIPLHAYQLIYPKAVIPDAPLFKSAAAMIENALYNETLAWALSLGADRRTLEAIPGFTSSIDPEAPRPRLTTDYNITPPSDAARAQAKEKREKDGNIPHTKTVITKNPNTVPRFSDAPPRHWKSPGFGQRA